MKPASTINNTDKSEKRREKSDYKVGDKKRRKDKNILKEKRKTN